MGIRQIDATGKTAEELHALISDAIQCGDIVNVFNHKISDNLPIYRGTPLTMEAVDAYSERLAEMHAKDWTTLDRTRPTRLRDKLALWLRDMADRLDPDRYYNRH